MICASRSSSRSTVLMTSNCCRAQDGQEITVTPRRRKLSDLRISKAGLYFLDRIRRQRYADRVANSGPQQHTEADRRFYRAAAQSPGLGYPEMERVIARFGELLISRYGEKYV